MGKSLIVALCLSWSGIAAAQAYGPPGKIELRLEPIEATQFRVFGNGLTVIAPKSGNTQLAFGLGAGLGFLVTPLIEPGFALNLQIVDTGGTAPTQTIFGMTPFLKLNLWPSQHINPFFEPFAGFAIESAGGSVTLFDGGLFAGVEFLVNWWGIRLWSGFEAVAGNNTYSFAIPLRWAMVAYF
jgi:hypothetical protein